MIDKIKKYYIIILILFLAVGFYFTIKRLKFEKKYSIISYTIDYNTLLYNYTHFYANVTFNDYLKKLQSNKILSCIVHPLKITDLLNMYNSITLIRGIDLLLKKNNIFFPVHKNYLYLFTQDNLKITGLPYIKKINQNNKIIYVFNINFSQLNSYYLKFPIKYEQIIKKHLKLFYLKSIPIFGKIDSYIMINNNYVTIDKTLDFTKRYNKLHFYNKKGKEKFITENFRAILERNVKIIYIKNIKNKSNKTINFIPIIKKLNKKVKKIGYKIKQVYFFQSKNPDISFYLNKFGFYIIFTFIFSFILHKLFFLYLLSPLNSTKYIIFLSAIIFFSAFISTIVFNKLTYINAKFIPFIKLNLFIPYISLWFAYPQKKRKLFLNNTIKIKDLIIFSMFCGIFILLILRSGNYNLLISNFEIKTRDFLEKIFLIRPRFKDMFGYAFLYILFFNRKKIIIKNYLIIYVIALIGVTTTFNSFLHTHTPILITILRTIYGIVIGSGIGYFFNIVINKIDA